MSKFIYLYRGAATPMGELTPEQSEEQMQAWGQWIGRLGSSLVEVGNPFGERSAVTEDGGSATPGDLNGYSIVEAADLAAAKALADKHPYLVGSDGRLSVEVFELVPM